MCQACVSAVAMLIMGKLKWVKKERRSHSGHCLVCK